MDDAGDPGNRRAVCLPRLPHARHGVAHIETLDGVGEVAHEVAAAELTIREHLEPQVFLPRKNSRHVVVFQGA